MSELSSSLTTTSGFHSSWTTTAVLTANDLLTTGEPCSLLILYDLPPHVFVDPYELALFYDSFTFSLSGTRNLELPVMAIESSSSMLLLNVSAERTVEHEDGVMVSVRVPLHMRYGVPAKSGMSGYHDEQVPPPVGFLACPVSCNPTPRPLPSVLSPFSSMFDLQSVIQISSRPQVVSDKVIRIPLGRLDDLAIVEIGTTCVIVFAFMLILRTSLRVATRLANSDFQHAKID